MRTVLLGAMLILSGAAPLWADDSPPSVSILNANPPAPASDVYPSTMPPGEPEHGKGLYHTLPYKPGRTDVVPSTPAPSVAPLPSTTVPSYAVPVPYTAPAAAYSPYAKPQKADHLRSAAEHLEAAGEGEEAARVRQLLGDELVRQNKELLKQKEAQLQRLQQEVERLRGAVASPQQIMLEVKVYEVSLSKLRTLGVLEIPENRVAHELFGPHADKTTASLNCHVIGNEHPFLAMLNALEQNGLARTIGETCVVGALDRPASYVKADPSGTTTEVEFTPHRLSDERLRLDFRIKLSEQTEGLGPDEKGQPRARVREAVTGGDFEKGEILILGGLKQDRTAVEVNRDTDPPTKRTRTNSVVTVFVVHPKVFDSEADAATGNAAGAVKGRQ